MDNAKAVNSVKAVNNYQFIVPLTESQKARYDAKRRSEGKTSQGCLRKLVLGYIGEGDNDQRTDC